MAINIYQTQTMLAAVELMTKRSTFLRDRYFPTTANDIFVTEDVLIEIKDEGQKKIAPCVVPYRGGIPMSRDGYKTERYTPANVAPSRVLSIVDLQKKQFGETLFSQQQPAQREAALLRGDMTDLMGLVDGREEYMAAQTLLNNGYKMKHYADKYGGGVYEEYGIQFYDEDTNPARFVPADTLDTSEEAGKAFIANVSEMARMLTKRGLAATDLIIDPTTASVLLNNEWFLRLMDNRRLDLLSINPQQLPSGVTSFGKVNINGKMIEIFCYEEEYVDETGKTQQFIPAGEIILTAPAMGKTLYGAVTQMEEADREYHTYPAKRVPRVTTDTKNSIKELTMTAKPLTMPKFKSSAISAKVIF